MAWLAVDEDGKESIFANRPKRDKGMWWDIQNIGSIDFDSEIPLPKGSIKKLIGRDLTWKDEPVELKRR